MLTAQVFLVDVTAVIDCSTTFYERSLVVPGSGTVRSLSKLPSYGYSGNFAAIRTMRPFGSQRK